MKHSSRSLSFASALLLLFSGRWAYAVHEQFESAEVSWRLVDSDGTARLLRHERDFTTAHSGKGSEHIRLQSTYATYVYLAHPIPPARIIGELVPSLWVKADRPGLRLALRVVLPRAKDREGKTLTVMLEGDFYTQAGTWQRLQVRNLKKLLEAEVRIRRLLGPVDEHEAYVDHVVLNAYTGPGFTELWTDDLELVGFASSQRLTTPTGLTGAREASTPIPRSTEREIRSAELRGSVLLIEGQPFFARVIEYNGEPFTWLKELGFNTILLRSPPNAAQLSEAELADVWLVAPPSITNGQLDLNPAYRRIIAWRLGTEATAAESGAIGNLAAQVRRQDSEAARPIVCDAKRDIASLGDVSDLLMFGRETIGTGFDLQGYGDWLRQQLRPVAGKPWWGTVQTEPSSRLVEQLAIAHASLPPPSLGVQLPKLTADPDQIRLVAFETIAAGARGVCFRSNSRLDLDDDAATLRAAALRLVNSELALIEPWAAGGLFAEEIDMHDPHTRGYVLETERSRLLIATRHQPGQQYVPHPRRAESISTVVHSVPITDQAYHLSSNGLQPLLSTQTTGPRITIRDPDSVSLVVFTQDPLVINRSARELSKNKKQAAALRHQIAANQLRQTMEIVGKLGRLEPVKSTLDESGSLLDRAEQLLRRGDSQNAMAATRAADQLIRRVRRETWEESVLAFPAPTSSLLCSSFATLPLHDEATNRLGTADWGTNQLSAGDCESLDTMLRSGWRQHVPDKLSGATLVELSQRDPAGGRSALRMVVWRSSRNPTASNARPLSIVSAPVTIDAGQSFRVHGWVKVPGPIVGGRDGLMIYDSASGEEFAERIFETDAWREFTIYRVATHSGAITLTFALDGYGEVWIDEVSVTILK